jgi:hypothetical protein
LKALQGMGTTNGRVMVTCLILGDWLTLRT